MFRAAMRNPVLASAVGAACAVVIYLVLSALISGINWVYVAFVAVGSFVLALAINLLFQRKG